MRFSSLLLLCLIGVASAHINDHFQNPTDLGSVSEITLSISPGGATRQMGEPRNHGTNDGSLWWKWTAPGSGKLVIDASDFQEAELYQGTSFDNLVHLRPDFGVIEIPEGGVYLIATAGDRPFEFQLNFTPTPDAPPNDHFATRTILPWDGGNFTYEGTFLKATREEGEPALTFNQDSERSIWLEWTAPEAGIFTIATAGATDQFAVYQGDALTELKERVFAQGDNALQVQAGETLMIQLVDTTWGEGRGTTVDLTFAEKESNDLYFQAIDLGSQFPQTVTTNLRGTSYWNADGTTTGQRTGWWKWTAPSNGSLKISQIKEGPQATHRGFFSVRNDQLTAWPVTERETTFGSRNDFAQVHAGDEILIRMSERSDVDFSYFQLSFEEAAANDNIADAIDLGSNYPLDIGPDPAPATTEPGLPGSGFDRWWTWLAPETGRVVVWKAWAYGGTSLSPGTILANEQLGREESFLISKNRRIWLAPFVRHFPHTFRDNPGAFRMEFYPYETGNDDFADAAVLPSLQTSHRSGAILNNATWEPNEPDPFPGGGIGRSRWWTWTAPFSGDAFVDVLGASGWVSVFQQSPGGQLAMVADRREDQYSASFSIESGTQYWIRMEERPNSSTSAEFTLDAFPTEGSPDDLADAFDLGQVESFQGRFLLRQATLEEEEPTFRTVVGWEMKGSLWLKWTAPAAGELTVDQGNTYSNYGRSIMFRSSPFEAPDEDFLWNGEADVDAGEVIWIGIFDRTTSEAPGTFTVNLSFEAEDPAGPVSLAIDLGNSWEVESKTLWEQQEPFMTFQERWLKWTAPADGAIATSVEAETYQGTDETDLTPLGEGSHLFVEESQTYYFRVSERSPNASKFNQLIFSLYGAPAPPNDDFENATLIEGEAAEVAFRLTGASYQENEPNLRLKTLWWRWEPTTAGTLDLGLMMDGAPQSYLPQMKIYWGDDFDQLIELGTLEDWNDRHRTSLPVGPGQVIMLQMGTSAQGEGDLRGTFDLSFSPTFPNDSRATPSDLGTDSSFSFTADNTGALRDPDAWGGQNGNARPKTWYRWSPPAGGFLYLSTTEGFVRLHAGDGGRDDTPIKTVSPNQNGPVRVEAHKSYLISYEFDNQGQGGPSRIQLEMAPLNPGSSASRPYPLAATSNLRFEGDFSGAYLDETVDYQSLSFDPAAIIWYSWTAPEDGIYVARRISGYARISIWESQQPSPHSLLEEGDNSLLQFRAQAGQNYLIAAASNTGPFTFLWELERYDEVPNDQFSRRVNLGNEPSLSFETHNYLAGLEEDEPEHGSSPTDASLWFSWRAPFEGDFLISALRSRYEQQVAIYLGDPFGEHLRIASNPGRVILNAIAGQTYNIALSSNASESRRGPVQLEVAPANGPDNDNFMDRQVVSSSRPIFHGSMKDSSIEPGEPGLPDEVLGTVWFEWTPTSRQSVYNQFSRGRMNYFSSNEADPGLEDLVHLNATQANWDRFTAASGTTYYFQLIDRDSVDPGPFSLDLSNWDAFRSELVRNDRFEDRIMLPTLTEVRTGTTAGGLKKDDAEPIDTRFLYSAWWSWTAPESGLFLIDAPVSGIFVYTGETMESLERVDERDSYSNRFFADAGITYHIAIGTRFQNTSSFRPHGASISFELRKATLPPENDNFEKAQVLDSDFSWRSDQNNYLATAQIDEPRHGDTPARRTVWSKWTPDENGPVTISVSGSETTLGIFTGSEASNLTAIVSGVSSHTFSAISGTTYFVSVDSPAPLKFSLRASPIYSGLGNDDFANAIQWTSSSHFVRANSEGFRLENLEPHPLSASENDRSSWWLWTAPSSGATEMTFDGSSSSLSVYQGDDFANLRIIKTTSSSSSPIRFHAVAGTSYAIQMINRASGSGDQFSLSLEQSLISPTNDLFANPISLSGTSPSVTANTSGATLETEQPFHGEPAIWYSWQVPETSRYQLKLQRGDIRLFQGSSLESLTLLYEGGDTLSPWLTAGQEIRIAISDTSLAGSRLTIVPLPDVNNDDFENRQHLGSGETVTWSRNLQHSTLQEHGPFNSQYSIDGSLWWSWTAPRSGLVTMGGSLIVFTGESIEHLGQPLPPQRFFAEAGKTYQLAATTSQRQDSSLRQFAITMASTPNDDFEDAALINTELPFHWQGSIPNATFESSNNDQTRGTAWWKWTAPRDGAIAITKGDDDLELFVESPLLKTRRVYTSGFPSLIPVSSGETYFLQLTGRSLDSLEFSFDWAGEEIHQNTSFESAQEITRLDLPIEVFAPVTLQNSFCYYWDATRTGLLTLYGPDLSSSIYSGPGPLDLKQVIPHHRDSPSVWVEAGTRYWFGVRTKTSGTFTITPSLGPAGDLFAEAPSLASQDSLQWNGSTVGAGREPGEYHMTRPERSVWRTWTAPRDGTYRFAVSHFVAGIFQGDQLEGLGLVAFGDSRVFTATGGEQYFIVVESGTQQGPFQFTLEPISEDYEAWRDLYFSSGSLTGLPLSDPDGDGRSNLLEMALGSSPTGVDGALDLWMEVSNDSLILNVLRPTGVQGIEYSFDLSNNLGNWSSTNNLEHQTQTEPQNRDLEIFRVILPISEVPNLETLYVRLRARLIN